MMCCPEQDWCVWTHAQYPAIAILCYHIFTPPHPWTARVAVIVVQPSLVWAICHPPFPGLFAVSKNNWTLLCTHSQFPRAADTGAARPSVTWPAPPRESRWGRRGCQSACWPYFRCVHREGSTQMLFWLFCVRFWQNLRGFLLFAFFVFYLYFFKRFFWISVRL